MGNQIDGDRWVFDSVSTTAEIEKLRGRHQITGLFWVEDAARDIAADDNLKIVDGDGLIIMEKTAAGTPATASNELIIPIADPGLMVHGFKVELLDGGILIVWLKLPYT